MLSEFSILKIIIQLKDSLMIYLFHNFSLFIWLANISIPAFATKESSAGFKLETPTAPTQNEFIIIGTPPSIKAVTSGADKMHTYHY